MFGDSSYPTPAPSVPSTTPTIDPGTKLDAKNIQIVSHNQYHSPNLSISDFPPSPFEQFRTWFEHALSPNDGAPPVKEPEAVCISTATPQGVPSARMVLLRRMDEKGFVFFTNYSSRKSGELAANPYASMVFYWKEQARQIRIVGKVEKVKREESQEYFATRPRGSQLGAWASEQSQVVGETTLRERVREFEERFEGNEVECPKHWGGWKVVPL
jgi:pyridoxamine-phosphate oxidase